MSAARAAVWPWRAGLPLLAFVCAARGARSVAADARACGAVTTTQKVSAPQRPGPEVLRAPGFARVQGASPEAACAPPAVAAGALHGAVRAASEALGVDPALALVLTSAPLSCPSMYYVALANDVRGIGYRHVDGREVFDDTPDSALEGIAFLNDWPYWQAHPDELAIAFNHEVAHRWGARVHVRAPGLPDAALLGRDHEHWSYFLSTEGSPLEGNAWIETSAGYQSRTTAALNRFSALDLYLMGVATPREVSPLVLLTSAATAASDCAGREVSAASPPQRCADLELRADAVSVGVEDVIAAEGPRAPESSSSRELDALVIVLEPAAAPLSLEACEELSPAIERRFIEFHEATWGRLALRNVLDASGTCEHARDPEPAAADEVGPAAACGLQRRARDGSRAAWLVLLACWFRRRTSGSLPSE